MMKIETNRGFTEAVLNDNCDFDEFYKIAAILKSILETDFTNKLNDFDTLYWDFKYKDTLLTLHYNIYLGVSIFPNALRDATSLENRNVLEVSKLLNS